MGPESIVQDSPPQQVAQEVPRPETTGQETSRQASWPWRIGCVIDSGALVGELAGALEEMSAAWEFQVPATAPPYEVAALVGRQRPDVVFVELASIAGSAADWINIIRAGNDVPLVVAVHKDAEAAEMIAALRAGASEFLSSPVRPGIFEAMDRIATQLEARQTATSAPGKLIGVLSAKGGCGATTLACHLAVALQRANGTGRVLMADLDHQSPSAHCIYKVTAHAGVGEAFSSVRRLNSACWPEFVTPVAGLVDLLAGMRGGTPPEPWRIENLFRFVRRHYTWVLADLGRHLTPSNWAFLPSVEELLIVTAPDVLALYQTRSVLQTLTNRGFEKSRVRLILNRNQNSPQDFWIESIEQMFDMTVLAVLPHDSATLATRPRDPFEFPSNSAYGRSVSKMAGRILKPAGPDSPGTTKTGATRPATTRRAA